MNVAQQTLAVYQKAVAAVKAKKATPEQELIVALWDQVQEQEATLRAQAYKLSVLETQESMSDFDKQVTIDEGMRDAMDQVNRIRYNIH